MESAVFPDHVGPYMTMTDLSVFMRFSGVLISCFDVFFHLGNITVHIFSYRDDHVEKGNGNKQSGKSENVFPDEKGKKRDKYRKMNVR